MDRVKDTLEEVYLNMDTIEMLKEQECNMDEIVNMFSETAEYPPELTHSLAKTKKSLIKSLLLRIQFYLTKKKLDAEEIQNNLQAVNKNYGLIVGKLLEGLNEEPTSDSSPEEVVKSESSHKHKKSKGEKDKKEKPAKVKTPVSVASEASEAEEEFLSKNKKHKDNSDLDEGVSVNSDEEVEEDQKVEADDEEDDKLGKYIKDCLEKTDDEDDHLKLSEIYKDFKSWFGKNYEDDIPNRKDLKSYLIEKLGKQVNGGWSNYTFKGGDESDSE